MTTIYRPATGEVLTEVADTDPSDIDAVFARARAASEVWRRLSGTERSALLFALADRLEEQTEAIALTEARNTGKAIRETRAEASRMPSSVRYWAGWADKIYGTTVPVPGDFHAYTVREPYGIVVGIIPWNVPYIFAIRKIVTALATGNVIVLKPALETPLTALMIAEACREVGIPDGVVQIVTGAGDIGAALVAHSETDLICFTGFHETGKHIARSAANNLTPTIQELGGKSPQIVFADADLDEAMDAIMVGVFASTGQMCIAGSRLLLQDGVPDAFLERLADRVSALRVGDPEDEATQVGPHVTATQRDKTLAMIQAGRDAGATVAASGAVPDDERLRGGYYVPPTIFTDVTVDMPIMQDEIFGPVLSVMRFRDEEEAVALANSTQFGLAAGVWTSDSGRVHRMARDIRAGMIWLNTYRIVHDMVPGGGFGLSGYGAEGGLESIQQLTRNKSVWTAMRPGLPAGYPRI
ncbi:aldehyde dehydrogenase family protein [Rhodococcus sp. HM1]|uniref:aldehyde dehydrogenase family protein n=1 Tax=unclassified Rhodococcus (in: high G+C Gram-positive bacteria) TaxID=192944 RepID=UPI0018CF306D|nr:MULTISPECIES: aldehyde dehydrogenase family protein [unclassified Rhodococcus (in: high G+C Gram-positive bacteria)]MBH0119786.1 aldehyde dehydrogenase family protein [Rhodococcus sp. CX]MCK8672811.1 aldehyde dehydrogenase family protein [Rhodococcus sp. HM1]